MDNSGKEAEAMALLAEAERKVKNSQSFFSGLFGQQPADQTLTQFLLEPLLGTSNPWEPWRLAFLRQRLRPRSSGGSSKIEEACEIYARAANMFKMAKNWSAAGNAFCQAAQLHLQLQSKHDAATCFVDAGNAFKKADPQEAINCLMRAIEIYTDMGRLRIQLRGPGGVWLSWDGALRTPFVLRAPSHVSPRAGSPSRPSTTSPLLRSTRRSWWTSRSSANKCLLKVAGYAAQLEQYQKAIDIYEQVGTNAMDSPLLKYSAKDYFFKAALCHFCIDMLNAKLAVQKYEELFPAFSDSRECKLMKKLLDAHEEQNVDSYTEAVKEYDAISRLDQWLTTMLLRIKKTIQGDEEDLR
ncbi:alpha-soluble NSF attachment protein isoform X4 [Tursiops truncatus]|uniref:alpha-soluble NSF attachment protein isoform X4 n=1 Tax=Tursiops truncatus TaxID=9739 RepID=UPI003CCF6192